MVRAKLSPLVVLLETHKIPQAEAAKAYLDAVVVLRRADAETCVRTLAGEGHSLKAQHEVAKRLAEVFTDEIVLLFQIYQPSTTIPFMDAFSSVKVTASVTMVATRAAAPRATPTQSHGDRVVRPLCSTEICRRRCASS